MIIEIVIGALYIAGSFAAVYAMVRSAAMENGHGGRALHTYENDRTTTPGLGD